MDAESTAEHRPERTRSSVVPRLVGGFLVVVAIGGFFLLRARAAPRADLFGTRLGYTANDTRDRFRAGAPGTWTVTSGSEAVLAWTASEKAAKVRDARFEFHDGILVAETFHVAADVAEAKGASLVLTTGSVTARDRAPDGDVEIRVVSRECPTHTEEVRRILQTRGDAQH